MSRVMPPPHQRATLESFPDRPSQSCRRAVGRLAGRAVAGCLTFVMVRHVTDDGSTTIGKHLLWRYFFCRCHVKLSGSKPQSTCITVKLRFQFGELFRIQWFFGLHQGKYRCQ